MSGIVPQEQLRVGFIGLGAMGQPMARRLLAAGQRLTVYNRTADKVCALEALGAQRAQSPADLAQACDVVFTMLTADAAVVEVLFAEAGVAAGARPGTVLIDCSTVSPHTSRQAASRLAELGVRWLDAPVSGSVPQAESGQLTFMVGGDKSVYATCQPQFAILGKAAYYMGGAGSGAHAKLAINTMLGINLLALAEGLALAKAGNLALDMFTQVIAAGGARSGVADSKATRMATGQFDPQFMVELLHKDLLLASQLATEHGLPLPVMLTVRSLLQIAIADGDGRADMAAVFRCYDNWLGTERG
ncbi:MAG: NAD(P)-dependent oxidoreductase [Firmicutes bacterium]|nr:NAD(P)-dependent oxidoreductase [Bacillota bacterium]